MEFVRAWLLVQMKVCWHEEIPGVAVGLGEGLHHVGVLEAGELARVEEGSGVTRPHMGWCLLTSGHPRVPGVRHQPLAPVTGAPLQAGVTLPTQRMVECVAKQTFLPVVSLTGDQDGAVKTVHWRHQQKDDHH